MAAATITQTKPDADIDARAQRGARTSKVAVVYTTPATVLDDIGEAMRLAGYNDETSPAAAARFSDWSSSRFRTASDRPTVRPGSFGWPTRKDPSTYRS